MSEKTRKEKEELIIETVVRYKAILCQEIKLGKRLEKEGMLYEPGLDYFSCWKAAYNPALSADEREICRINFILSSLPKKEMNIIWNDFFFTEDKFWWMRIYNRSTYYRIRARAINNFVALLV